MAPLSPQDRAAWSRDPMAQAISDTLHADECADWIGGNRDEWVTRRYGKTPDQLLAAAERELAMGNDLVAYCLREAAAGRAHKRRHRPSPWRSIAYASAWAITVVVVVLGVAEVVELVGSGL